MIVHTGILSVMRLGDFLEASRDINILVIKWVGTLKNTF